MTQRLYVLPVVHLTTPNHNVPKYLPHRFNPAMAGLEGVRWAWQTYLLDDLGVLVADVTTAQNTLLSGQSDVLVVPTNLDSTVPNTTTRNRIRTLLEAAGVPGTWVNTGMVYRTIVRSVLGCCQYHNRLVGLAQRRLFDGSVNLDMTVGQLPAGIRDRLQGAADGLGLDYSWVTASTTLRTLFKGMGDQYAARELRIDGAGMSVVI